MPDRSAVALDLVPPELILPRLRVAAGIFAGFGLVLGVVAALLLTPEVGLALALALVASAVWAVISGGRRRLWIDHGVVSRRGTLRTRRVNVTDATSVELVVRVARVSQVVLRVGDDGTTVTVPLALYTGDSGRELGPVALRAIADALARSSTAPAAAMASVLITQLRAEARDAGAAERPLHRAVGVIERAGRAPVGTLTDSEVASLVD
ncbi:hypothetical protein [Rhodococcoides kroppenstedtii]|uniref:hypothetical protein n=1 Tax=Rhodococcoides kroppenstedtii TaxID=293050 RepID=UPI0016982CC0|nr:hypothetical protein [Rhodococcus kroppenstedtii]NIL79279.1 hypothetical protein [Rhodococcus kroppenstedtii]